MQKTVLLLLILTTSSLAAADQTSHVLDQVIVSASRIEEKVKEAPVTVNVVPEAEMEKIKFRNPADLLSRLPGIYSHDFGGESELTSIRVQTHFTNPYTIILLDGVPISNYGSGSSSQFSEINTDNIERIEVIKGPASALYGSNAIGGVINVITKSPAARPEVKAWTELGEDEQWRSGISGSGSGDTLSFNLGLNHIDSKGWREQVNLNKKAADIKLQYTPYDSGVFSLKLDWLSSENDSPGSLKLGDFENDWQQSYYTFTYSKMDKITPQLSYTHFFDQGEFKSSITLRDVKEESIPQYAIRQQTYGAPPRPYVGSFTRSEGKTYNLQLLYSHDLSILNSKLIVGIDSEEGNNDSDSWDIIAHWDPGQNKFTSYTMGDIDKSYDITTKATAPYMQLAISPLDKLKITAGGRYDSTKYEVENKIGSTNEGEKKFSKFSPKVGLTYDITSYLNSYFSYAKGFVVPTTSQLLTSTRGANIDLLPEKADNYEIGLRASLWQNRVAMDLALYTMDITDKIISNDVLNVNAGETSQKGFEANMILSPLEQLRLTISYTYAENQYEKYVTNSADYSGNWVPRAPKSRLNARLALMPVKGLEIELEMDEISSQYVDDNNIYKYSRPALFHLRATYDWQQWSVWSHLKNLTDREYASYVSYSDPDVKYYPGSPITLFAGVSYKWGQ